MMLFKLSLKNIKKSFKDYAIYFFTLILGVAIFYVFNAIESQTVLLNVNTSTGELIELMNSMLSGVSVFVSFILGFLIIYASRFLIRRRNKEFGVYLTLGMSKRKISMILFIETIFIGIISLFIGLGLGAILSQFMSLLVANMFEADMTNFAFTFSVSATIKTFIYFGIMYVLVMLFNTIQVSKCKLIDLLYASKKSEKVKMKNPFVCIIVFLIGVGMLSYAYYIVTGGVEKHLQDVNQIYIPILLGVVSTFLIFWSLSGFILRIMMSLKGIYYKGLNSFTLRQISSKVNTAVFSITIICLMLFVTICVLSSALSIKNSMNANINDLAPADIELSTPYNTQNKNDVKSILKSENYNIETKLKERVIFNIYSFEDITLKTTLGENLKQVTDQYRFLSTGTMEEFIKLSDYNKLANLYGKDTYTLKDNEYIIIADFESMLEIRNIALSNNEPINILNKDYYPKYKECQDGIISMAGNHINTGVIIVPDSVDLKGYEKRNYLIGKYNTNDKEEKMQIEEEFDAIYKKVNKGDVVFSYNSRIDIEIATVGLGAMVTFIGLYLGIIFLISSAAILALKELSESTDNIERYRMLRKIGTDEKMINRALFKQIAIFFLFPLVLALIHSYFGLEFAKYILEVFGKEELLKSVGVTMLFLTGIYGGYFLITYYSSKNIIKENR